MQNNILNELMQLLQMGQNPQQFMMNILNVNPQAQALFNQAQKSGNMEQFVRNLAKENNIDIQPFIDMLSGRK